MKPIDGVDKAVRFMSRWGRQYGITKAAAALLRSHRAEGK